MSLDFCVAFTLDVAMGMVRGVTAGDCQDGDDDQGARAGVRQDGGVSAGLDNDWCRRNWRGGGWHWLGRQRGWCGDYRVAARRHDGVDELTIFHDDVSWDGSVGE